jgi:hypothetical protein
MYKFKMKQGSGGDMEKTNYKGSRPDNDRSIDKKSPPGTQPSTSK